MVVGLPAARHPRDLRHRAAAVELVSRRLLCPILPPSTPRLLT